VAEEEVVAGLVESMQGHLLDSKEETGLREILFHSGSSFRVLHIREDTLVARLHEDFEALLAQLCHMMRTQWRASFPNREIFTNNT
jgi:hypothetical protein